MKKLNLLFLLILLSIKAFAQVDGSLLLGLINVSNAEIATITSPPQGALFYNTDDQKLFVNTPAGFTGIPSLDPNTIDFWSAIGTTGSNPAVNFLGTTDAQDMVFRANNEERLLLSGSNQTVRINGATQFNNHPFVIRANVDDVMAFQTAGGVTEWHWNLVGNGLNFVETGVADFRVFMEQGGNVGIDTGAPSEKLDVNGSLRVRTATTTTSDLDVLVTTATGVVQKRTFTNLSENIISGTEGSVFFASSTGNATENNAEFFWDDTNERLGIGTATPTSDLDINGSVSKPIIATSGALTLDESHHTIIITANTHTITLPAASSCTGRIYVVKNPLPDTGNNSNNVTISGFIDQRGNIRTNVRRERVYWLQSDGTDWHLISRI